MAATVQINQGGRVAATLTLQNTGGQSATVVVMLEAVSSSNITAPFRDSSGNPNPTVTIAGNGGTQTLNLTSDAITTAGTYSVDLTVTDTTTLQSYITQAVEGTVTVLSPANVVVQSISLSPA